MQLTTFLPGFFRWRQPSTGNKPGRSVSVTALVRKSLKADRQKLGFVFLTDTALKNDNYSCAGQYSNFALVVKPSK